MLLSVYPFHGQRIGGKLIPKKNSFRNVIDKLLTKPKECQCGKFDEGTCDCLTGVEARRLKFVKELRNLGIPFEDICMHSWRKGSASAAASGSTCAPSIVAICIRAGWKISKVLSKYLSMENAGDHFCGRVVAGLNPHLPEFAVLPPRFKKDLSAEDQKFIEQVFKSVFPNPTQWGFQMLPALKHLLATLAYHTDYLQKLPWTHPFWKTYLGMQPNVLQKLQSMVELVHDGERLDCR